MGKRSLIFFSKRGAGEEEKRQPEPTGTLSIPSDATSVRKVALLSLSFHSLSPVHFFATFNYIVVKSQNFIS